MSILYYNIRHNRFYFDTEQENKELAVWVDSAQGMKDMLSTMLRGSFFMGKDKKPHDTDKERELFFLEYIPRVFGGVDPKIYKVKGTDDLPEYNWENHVKMKDIENPKPSKGDIAHKAIKAAISSVPVVGAPGAEFFDAIIKPPLEKRRDEFLDSVALRINELEKKKAIHIENLSQNKIFITVIMYATQSAIKNHQEEKLEALRNAVLNSAIGYSPDENLQVMFISYIDDITEWHLKILKLLSAPNTWRAGFTPDLSPKMNQVEPGTFYATFDLGRILLNNFPQLQGEYGFYEQIIRDLNARGLIKTDSLQFTTRADGKMNMDCVTDIGKKFIDFITSPLEK